jgi:cardiolipin-specific phospholipase
MLAPQLIASIATSIFASMTSIITNLFASANAIIASRVESLQVAEANLLDLAKQRFSPDLEHEIEVFDTDIPRSALRLSKTDVKCQINTVDALDEHFIVHGVKVVNPSSSSTSSGTANPLVILHGYMNGSLYFYRNLLGLARHFKAVYSLDQLGWGLSSRPDFDHVVPPGQGSDGCPIEASENFFVESLEAWREANSIEKMNLCGHSMGGYLSVAYAERYPEHVDRLILLSPVGVPEQDPENDPLSKPNIPLRFKFLFGTFRYLWSRGTTPGSFARSIPQSQARNMIDKYVEGRLPQVTCSNERQVLGDYLFHSAMLPGSGEFSLNRILKPGAYARKPTVSRIPNLKVDSVSFVYGQYDWMDCSGGLEVQRRCQEMYKAGKEVPRVEVYGVSKAGHMLQIENWQETNAAIILAAGGKPDEGSHHPGRFIEGVDDGRFFKGSRFRSSD